MYRIKMKNYKCNKCNKEFDSCKSIAGHIRHSHKDYNPTQYYIDTNNYNYF